MAIILEPTDALLVVDAQNGFVPGGNLSVPRGDEIVPLANRVAQSFRNVVLTQDWHPAGHISFASRHPGKRPFEWIRLPYGEQILWPDHCVQGTPDADFHPALSIPHAQLVVRKGYHPEIDSYSAFLEADKKTHTGLAGYLKERGLRRVFLCGLATDFCEDALGRKLESILSDVLYQPLELRSTTLTYPLAAAWRDMQAAGVRRTQSGEIMVP